MSGESSPGVFALNGVALGSLSSIIGFCKQLNGYAGLLDSAPERACGEFLMHWNHTSSFSTPEDNMAAFLANDHESEHLERLDGILTRDARQFRH